MSKPTRFRVMQTAAKELGYAEQGGSDGRSGNITKFWADHYPQWQGSPWCGAFVYWVLQKHKVGDHPIGKTGIFYTPAIVNAAKAQGIWRSDSTASLSKIKPGDLVLFDFNGSGNAQHVGFAEKYLGGGNVQTIEGNTSPTNRGSQNNGGGVYRRVRNTASIMGYVDMSKWLATGTGTTAAKTESRSTWLSKKIAVHGWLSPATIKRLQAEVGAPVDGILGPQTKKAVQKWLGVSQDGVWGPKTHAALRKRLGASNPTGGLTKDLIKAWQRHLNSTRR